MTTKERKAASTRNYHTWDEIVGDLSPEQRVADEAAEESLWQEIAEYHLAEIRRVSEITQAEMARRLENARGCDPKTGPTHDYSVSTIRSIVESLGGRLELTAVFDAARLPIPLPTARPERDQPAETK